ncbi:MAG: hypothetical protein ACE5E5_14190 [Phycisphaerae bacterium]
MNARNGPKAVMAMLSASLLMAATAMTGCDTPQAGSVAPEAARALSLFEIVPGPQAMISVDGAEDFDDNWPTE